MRRQPFRVGPLAEFGILGSLHVASPAEVRVGGAKKRALVARLLVDANRVVPVAQLAEELWPGNPAVGAGTLRTYVSQLRRVLGADRLLTRSAGYLIVVGGDELDAARFEALVERARRPGVSPAEAVRLLEEAEELWRGPALTEFADAGWARAPAERLDRRRLDATADRLERELRCGRAQDTVSEAGALVHRHPLDERLWGLLIVGHYRCGRPADALRAYQRARVTLVEQVGAEPGPRLRSLERALLDHDPRLDGAPPTAGGVLVVGTGGAVGSGGAREGVGRSPGPGGRPVGDVPLPAEVVMARRGALVGRGGDAARLGRVWRRALAGERRLVLVGGEPGIGKTRLAAELAAAAHDERAVVLWGRCDDGMEAAYQPVVEALGHYARHCPEELLAAQVGEHWPTLGRLVPELASRSPRPGRGGYGGVDPGTERLLLFAAVSELLGAISRPGGLVLVVDDLHWAAGSTLALVRRLARPALDRTLIVATYRDTEAGPEHLLRPLLAELHREPTVAGCWLGGLDEGATGGLLPGGGGLDASAVEVVRAVHEASDGNPFYAGQILAHLVDTGLLRQAAGRWAADVGDPGAGDLPLPPALRDVVRGRVSALPAPAQAVLAMAAVAGRDATLALLERVLPASTGSRGDGVLTGLEQAMRARLVQHAPDGRESLAFVHDLVRQTVYEDIAAPHRARLHRRVGEALAEGPGADREPAAVARHLVAGVADGGRHAAIDWSERAGLAAMERFAPDEAAAHLGRAIALVEGHSPADQATRARLLRAHARAEGRALRLSAAKQAAVRACHDAEAAGSAELLADAAIAYVRWDRAGVTDPASAPLLEHALRRVGGRAPGVRARLLAMLAFHRAISGGPGTSPEALANEALALARQVSDPQVLADVLGYRAWALLGSCHVGRQDATLAELATLVDAAPFWRSWIDHLGAVVRLQTGDLPGFDRHLGRIAERCRDGHDPFLSATVAMCRAARTLLEGRFGAVEDAAAEVQAVAAHDPNYAASHAGLLFYLRRDQGRLDELEPLLRAALDQAPGLVAFRAALALVQVERDRLDEAGAIYRRVVCHDLAHPPPSVVHAATYAALAEVGTRLGDTEHLDTLTRALEPYAGQILVAGWGAACIGAADRYLGMLAAASHRWPESRRHFERALRLERGLGSTPLTARTQAAYGQALRRSGDGRDRRRADEALEAAAATARALAMAGVAREVEGAAPS